jgi:hypothetical protein
MAKRIYTVEIDDGKITVSSEGVTETVSREVPKSTDWPDGTVTPWTLAIFIDAGFDNCDGAMTCADAGLSTSDCTRNDCDHKRFRDGGSGVQFGG